jgi:hypothetical protein
VAEARQRFPGLAMEFMDRLQLILQLRQQVRQRLEGPSSAAPKSRTLSSLGQLGSPPPAPVTHPLADELANLVSSRFLERLDYDRLPEIPRYLKALLLRIERASFNPAKNQERLRQLAPYLAELKKLRTQPGKSAEAKTQTEKLRWMIEEFKVSLFAQELGTSAPISPKRLDQQLETIRNTP